MVILPNGIQLAGVLPKGESEVELTINIVNDSIPEPVEEFSVALVPVNYAAGERSEALVYIQDDDGEWREGRVVFESLLPLVHSNYTLDRCSQPTTTYS